MLQGLSPLLTPDLLHMLASMGHGDELAIVDANFPAAATAGRQARPLVTCMGIDAPALLDAVLSVLPLDASVTTPAFVMVPEPDAKVDFPDGLPEAAVALIAAIERRGSLCGQLARFAFYERANQAFGFVRTGEMRVYGNVIIKKGVVSPQS